MLITDWAYANTGGSDSTRITPAGSAATNNFVYSGAVRNGSYGDFYIQGWLNVQGFVKITGVG